MFYNNKVTADDGKGGAIFVLDGDCNEGANVHPSDMCFVYEHVFGALNNKHFNNFARQGSVLYGGLLDRCIPPVSSASLIKSGKVLLGIDAFKENSHYKPTRLAISSKPVKVCLCVRHQLDCSLRAFNT